MRPLRLDLTAVGPYIGPLTLDFRGLGTNRLFLLHGATGSGKTMLLDAMCFALFGEATGERRTAKSLRSHYAPAHLRTEVTFDFALGSRQYRVWRRPEQERPLKRGSGTTSEPAKATLWLRTGLHDDEADGQVLAMKPQDVTAQVHELLGFTSDQFRHVTVLPQGEFQKFLNAPSPERETILEILFQTSRYRGIEEALVKREQESQRAVQQCRDRLDSLLRQAEVEDAAGLQGKRAATEERLEAATGQLVTVREARRAANATLAAGRDAGRRLRELRDAETAYDALATRKDEFARKSEEVVAARRAAPVEPVERDWRQRHTDSEQAAAAAAAARDALGAAGHAAEQVRTALSAEEAREPERNGALLHEQYLKELAGKVDQLGHARKDKEAAALTHRNAEQRLAEARRQVDTHTASIAQADAKIEGLSTTAAGVERHRAQAEELARVAANRHSLELAHERHAAASRAAGVAAGQLAAARQEIAGRRRAREEVEDRWAEAQAAILAQSLAPGHPCPVCGSVEHPAPAVSAQPLPAGKDRKRVRDELTRAEAACEAFAAAERQSEVDRASAAATVENLQVQLGEWTSISKPDFDARCASVRDAFALAKKAADDTAAVKQQREAFRGNLARWERERQDAEDAYRTTAAKLEAAAALEREREGGIPAELQVPGGLADALAEATSKVRALQAILQAAREAASGAEQYLSACHAQSEGADNLAGARLVESILARQRFEDALGHAGFAGEGTFRAAVRTAAQIEALAAAIDQYRGDLEAATDRLRRTRVAAEEVKAPDLEALEAALAEADRQLELGVREQERLEREAGECRRWIAESGELAQAIYEADRKHRVIAMLAQTAAGRNDRRITLQRFVQVTLLERVLAAATVRLQLMSNGRYWLRVAQDSVDRRTAGGLDLEIFDAHTGQPRRVSTLSGGESFLASLALALGLSDVVQSHAGGYHLESIFVDEGFGSLDPEALDLALATLRDLQQGGRLVGIISHVPELRQQIDVRLEVTKEKRGSTARFVVAGVGSSGEPLGAAD